METDPMRFQRQHLPIGDDRIPVVVASEGDDPKAVFMSYDAFLEVAATLYTAIDALRKAGVDPSILGPSRDDLDEFASWDDDLLSRPSLRLVVGGS